MVNRVQVKVLRLKESEKFWTESELNFQIIAINKILLVDGSPSATAHPTIRLDSHQNIRLHAGSHANVVLLTYTLNTPKFGPVQIVYPNIGSRLLSDLCPRKLNQNKSSESTIVF